MRKPAYASLIPPEVHKVVHEDQMPAVLCLALISAVTVAMAVNNSKKR